MNSTGIQYSPFKGGGGFVLHNIRLADSAQKFSAWFDREGYLVDCQGISLKTLKVGKVGNRQKDQLLRYGKHYASFYREFLAAEERSKRLANPGGQGYFG